MCRLLRRILTIIAVVIMFRSIVNSQYSPDIRGHLHRAVIDNEWTLQRMCLHKKFPVHRGCVNAIVWNDSGNLILSGSDDRNIVLTSFTDGKVIGKINTQHKANLFSANFFPYSGDKKTVSCSGDGVIIVSDLERNDSVSQDVFNCHQGPVYNVLTMDNEPHNFLSIGEDGTARWFDIRVKKGCQTSQCREDVLFTYQSPLTAVAVNSVSPHELAFGTSDSVIYVMDRRKLGIVISSSTAAQSVISKMSAGVDRQPHQITSLQFSPEGDQILASYSGDSVYLFDVKDPSTVIPMSDPVLKLEESFSIAKPRNLQNFKRIRLRGDWSDTGPSAGTEQTSPTQNNIGQARPTVHASLMQRLSDVLTSMMHRTSQRITSPTSPLGSPVPESSFPTLMARNRSLSESSGAASVTTPADLSGQPEVIDCVSYESLGRSSINNPTEGSDFPMVDPSDSSSVEMNGAEASTSSGSRALNDSGRRLESTFSSFCIRQDSEPSSSSGVTRDRESVNHESYDDFVDMDGIVEGDISGGNFAGTETFIHRPEPRMKYFGHRNARTVINEATFWGRNYVMSGSDCGHVFIWNRWSGQVVQVLQADRHVVNRVRPHPFEPVLATAGIDFDIKLWIPSAEQHFDINVEELMARNARMLEETRDTITVPATFMIRMLASLSQQRRLRVQPNSEDAAGTS